MSDDRFATGRAALSAALEKAGKHSAAAAVAAALVPLASLALAPSAEAGPVTITLVETQVGSIVQYDYKVTNPADPTGAPGIITDIVIPEVIVHAFNPEPILGTPILVNPPANWFAVYNSPATNITAGGKQVPNPPEFVHLAASGGAGISPGDPALDFILESDFFPTLNTTFQVGLDNSDLGSSVFVDPPTPNPQATTTTPEPGTLALLGGGLISLGLWRRRRQQ
jgi:hypothetical protein